MLTNTLTSWKEEISLTILNSDFYAHLNICKLVNPFFLFLSPILPACISKMRNQRMKIFSRKFPSICSWCKDVHVDIKEGDKYPCSVHLIMQISNRKLIVKKISPWVTQWLLLISFLEKYFVFDLMTIREIERKKIFFNDFEHKKNMKPDVHPDLI